MTQQVGFRSHLRSKVVDLERVLGRKITQIELAEASGISRPTIGLWMKSYIVMDEVNANILYAITNGLKKIARENGVKPDRFDVNPVELIEFVSEDGSLNK